MTAEQNFIRRVPLRTFWIKGIRTIWQLKRDFLGIWVVTIAIPVLIMNFWLNPKALGVVESLQSQIAQSFDEKAPDIVALVSLCTAFASSALAAYVLIFGIAVFGWYAMSLTAHRYFQGFPAFPVIELIRSAFVRTLSGGFIVVGMGLVLGMAGISGFPALDIVALMILMIPTYQIATKKSLFHSSLDCVALRYSGHFRGGRFLSLVQIAIMSLAVSTGVVAIHHFAEWTFVQASQLTQGVVATLPAANIAIAIARDALFGLALLVIPVFLMTFYYWLYSIPRMFPHEGVRV